MGYNCTKAWDAINNPNTVGIPTFLLFHQNQWRLIWIPWIIAHGLSQVTTTGLYKQKSLQEFLFYIVGMLKKNHSHAYILLFHWPWDTSFKQSSKAYTASKMNYWSMGMIPSLELWTVFLIHVIIYCRTYNILVFFQIKKLINMNTVK